MKICIDFDGTCVTHEFPKVGQDICAVPVLKELVANGHHLILFTMRSNVENNKKGSDCIPEVHNGNFLDDAIKWFKDNDIPLYGINHNPDQASWTSSPKAYGQLYIDDAALGAPLRQHICPEMVNNGRCTIEGCVTCEGKGYLGRPFIDWSEVRKQLVKMKLIQ